MLIWPDKASNLIEDPPPLDTTPIQQLEVERYMGEWYEIARFDNRFERDLECVTANYTLMADGEIEVVNRGYNTRRGEWSEAKGRAKRDRREPQVGRLRVSFFLWFYSDYNILELGDDYSWALVGSSSSKYLWILARTPTIEEQTLDHILTLAKGRGYPIERLIYPPPLTLQ